MRLLFPSDPMTPTEVDRGFVAEFQAAKTAGFDCSIFSFDAFQAGSFSPTPALTHAEKVLYRGWMVTCEGYSRLHAAIAATGAVPNTNPAEYKLCHHLPEWYPLCTDLTPETVFAAQEADFEAILTAKNWPAFFVKDYVKSLTTSRGSVATSPKQVKEIVTLIERYRGAIEGGVCIRKFESLQANTEERYFVIDKRAYAREGEAPPLVQEIAARISSPFYSVDVATNIHGESRLIELGDGQVSDLKKWPIDRFITLLERISQLKPPA